MINIEYIYIKLLSFFTRRIFLIVSIIFILSSHSYSQKFQLTNIQSTDYSIDRIAQQVYFKDFYSDTVRIIELKNLGITKTDFLIMPPILSNKLHLLVYRYRLYNIDKQSYFEIDNSQADSLGYLPNADFPGSFSPNDNDFMYGNPKYYIPIEDSALKPIPTGFSVYGSVDYNTNDSWPQWSSDTSIVFRSNDS